MKNINYTSNYLEHQVYIKLNNLILYNHPHFLKLDHVTIIQMESHLILPTTLQQCNLYNLIYLDRVSILQVVQLLFQHISLLLFLHIYQLVIHHVSIVLVCFILFQLKAQPWFLYLYYLKILVLNYNQYLFCILNNTIQLIFYLYYLFHLKLILIYLLINPFHVF